MPSLAKKIALLVFLVFFAFTFATPTDAAGLTSTQISAVIGLLHAFGADQSVIANVSAALGGTTSVSPSTPITNTTCVNLSNNLSLGDTDAATAGQVSSLQRFLESQVTGYFGPLTEQAVQQWQSSHGIVSSGSPETTGYGAVGPKTRSAMGCGEQTTLTQTTAPSTSVTPVAPPRSVGQPAVSTAPPSTNTPTPQTAPVTAAQTCPSGSTGVYPVCTAAAVQSVSTAPLSLAISDAPQAVSDLMKNFWVGDVATGHIAPTWNGIVGGTLADSRGGLWQASTLLNVLYGDYQRNPAGSSAQAIRAEWKYISDNFTENDFATCGDSSVQNWASDDTGWNANMLLQIYTVTQEPLALTYAKDAVTCGFRRWSDHTASGAFNGLWYSDVRSQKSTNDYHIKSTYDTAITEDALQIYTITKDPTYLTYAKESFDWMQQHLLRDDGLYWADYGLQTPNASAIQKAAGSPVASDRPGDIHLAGSVTFLGGNMGMGVLAEGLYEATGDASYKQDAISSAQAILSSVLVGKDNVFLNDRDAWANGHFARDWAQQVVPLLPADQQTKAKLVLTATANAVAGQDRTTSGYYGGCWGGPIGSFCAWDTAGSTANQITTSSNAADFIMAAALLGTVPPAVHAPVVQPLSITATLLGQTGEDYVGQLAQSPDGTKDVHIRLTGVISPVKSATISTPTGAWSYPANGTNWVVMVRPEPDPTTVDLYFDFYKLYTSYTVTLTLADGRTVTLQTTSSTPQVTARLLGQTGEDYVGQVTSGPDGVKDVHIKLTGVALPLQSIRVGTATGAWAYPANGTDWIALPKSESDPTTVDVYFDFYKQYAAYTLYLTFTNGATATIQTK